MSTPTKLTAKDKVLVALEAEGWNNIRSHYTLDEKGQSLCHVGKVPVESVVADGSYDYGSSHRSLLLEVFFSDTGAYKGRDIRVSGVDFRGYRTTLAGVLEGIVEWSPVNQQRKAEARAAEALDRKMAERRKANEEVATWKAEVDQFKRDLHAQLPPGEAAALLASGLFATYVHLTAQVSVVKWANAGVERSELVAYLLDPSGLDTPNVRV